MKKSLFVLALVVCLCAHAQPKREHRAVWETASLSEWPGKITSSNVDVVKASCGRMLDTLVACNMNAVYFHVRAYCDAFYKSKYEPWSSYVSSDRGVEPPIDPLAWLLQEAHKRGIEVYAWVNPYRYAHGSSMWGGSELDYVNTHPEWLMTTDYETVLNPGIPDVRQRVIDVCKDIVESYDIDGLVFDDYFYNQDGPSFDLDSLQYNAYVRRGGTMGQADWRRDNVNSMVAGVDSMIIATKPWVHFGIGPAGVAGADAEQWGVDPTPGTDWQYNQIYSDPLQWIAKGTIDFMAPQIYWNIASTYDELTAWWGKVGQKFNRHVFVSQTAGNTGTDGWDLGEYLEQVKVMRDDGLQGMVYFSYNDWRNNNTRYQDTLYAFRQFLKKRAYAAPSLTPAITWRLPAESYGAVQDLRRTADTLTWAAVSNARYVVYALPESLPAESFRCQAGLIAGVRYDGSFAIPAALQSGYNFAVTILDRYGNEYAPVLLGSTAVQASKPVLLSPADGSTAKPLNMLTWQSEGTDFNVQVFADKEMRQLVASVAVDSASLPIMAVPGMAEGQTYWWRVAARGLNLTDNVSDLESFTLGGISITAPAQGATGTSLTPEVKWTAAADSGVTYTLEISEQQSIDMPVLTATAADTSFTVPRYALAGAVPYYARVTASRAGAEVMTPVVLFTTLEVVPPVPELLTPSADGVTLYGPSRVETGKADGVQTLRVEISKSSSFPTRSSLKLTVDQGQFSTVPISEMTGSNAPKDGNDYYARARYAYRTLATGGTVQFTDYSTVRLFHYVQQMPGDINADGVVDAGDVAALVNLILTGAEPDLTVVDLNADGTLNTSDLTALIGMILADD